MMRIQATKPASACPQQALRSSLTPSLQSNDCFRNLVSSVTVAELADPLANAGDLGRQRISTLLTLGLTVCLCGSDDVSEELSAAACLRLPSGWPRHYDGTATSVTMHSRACTSCWMP